MKRLVKLHKKLKSDPIIDREFYVNLKLGKKCVK